MNGIHKWTSTGKYLFGLCTKIPLPDTSDLLSEGFLDIARRSHDEAPSRLNRSTAAAFGLVTRSMTEEQENDIVQTIAKTAVSRFHSRSWHFTSRTWSARRFRVTKRIG